MTPYLPYIFGTVSFFGGLYAFLLAFKIYQPKQETEEQKEKMENWHQKFGTWMKVLSIPLILSGAYDLIARDASRYSLSTSTNKERSEEDKENLINQCLKGAKTTVAKFPTIANEYCECTSESISSKMAYTDYLANLEVPKAKQIEIMRPLIQDCLNEFERQTKEKR